MNTPALDPQLMYDTREPNLQSQAFNAIHGHAQNTREPTALGWISSGVPAEGFALLLVRCAPKFCERRSSAATPAGHDGIRTTRPGDVRQCAFRWRDDERFATRVLGPMLNRAALGNPFGLPPGGLRAGIGVSERNLIGNPVYSFVVTNQDGSVVVINDTPDPGAMLNDPPPSAPPGVPTPPSLLREPFQNPAAVGHQDTAPYFHDNSAKTLEEVAEHYEFFFFTSPSTSGFVFTKQDQADMVAFLKLLR